MSGGAHTQMEQVRLRCAVCDSEQFIWRRRAKLRESGHVKHLWCCECRDRTPHVEVREP